MAFWTPGHTPVDDGGLFGCATHGLAFEPCWIPPGAGSVVPWPTTLAGDVLTGTYAAVMATLAQITRPPTAAIVLFTQATGMEGFLDAWQARFPSVPVIGGGAARQDGEARGAVLPSAEDVAVLLVHAGAWRVDSLNLHEPVGEMVAFRTAGPRTITQVRDAAGAWEPAAAWFRAWQVLSDLAPDDCESLTLSDTVGRNLHVTVDGACLHTGADLPADGRLQVRQVARPEVAARLTAFCAVPGALVFGCAGLRGLLDAPLPVGPGTLAGFMFGELVTLDGHPQFGNLMVARLTPVCR